MGEDQRNVRIVREIVEEVYELEAENPRAQQGAGGAQRPVARVQGVQRRPPGRPVMRVAPYVPEPQPGSPQSPASPPPLPPHHGAPLPSPPAPINNELLMQIADHVGDALQNLDNARNQIMQIADGQRPVARVQGVQRRPPGRPVMRVGPYVPEPQPVTPPSPESPVLTPTPSPQSPLSPLQFYSPPPSPQTPPGAQYVRTPPGRGGGRMAPRNLFCDPVPGQPAGRRLTYGVDNPDQPLEMLMELQVPPVQPAGRRLTYNIDNQDLVQPADRRLTYDIDNPDPVQPVDRRLTYNIDNPDLPEDQPVDQMCPMPPGSPISWGGSDYSQYTPESWNIPSTSGSIQSLPSIPDVDEMSPQYGGQPAGRRLTYGVDNPDQPLDLLMDLPVPPAREVRVERRVTYNEQHSPAPTPQGDPSPQAGRSRSPPRYPLGPHQAGRPPASPEELHRQIGQVADRVQRLEEAVTAQAPQAQGVDRALEGIRARVIRSQARVNEGIQRLQDVINRLDQNYAP